MDSSTANKVADRLLQEAAEEQTGKARRTAYWVRVVERLQIGLGAIISAGFGYFSAHLIFHNTYFQIAVGVVYGLAAAAFYPIKRLGIQTVRRS